MNEPKWSDGRRPLINLRPARKVNIWMLFALVVLLSALSFLGGHFLGVMGLF